jgi:hypothetical protein
MHIVPCSMTRIFFNEERNCKNKTYHTHVDGQAEAPEAEGLCLGDLTGNLRAMPARTKPIDVCFENAITCGG